jgi:hypothetical protein
VRYPTAIAAAATACLAAAGPVLAQAQAPSPAGGAAPVPVTSPTPATTAVTPVLGQSRLTPEQIASWFAKQGVTPAITIPITDLARIFVDEGNAQNVRGDIAFAQSVLETGWFRYRGSMVKPTDNNYSGLGACDSCSEGNRYASPTAGVRAQIQHLWAYADPEADPARVARPLTDTRMHYVNPYGRAPTWESMGAGNWATDPGYSAKVLGLYAEMLRHNGLAPQTTTLAKQEPACTDTFYEQATRTITWDRRRSAYKVVSRIRVFEDTQQRCRTDLTFIYRNPDTKVTLAQKAGSSLGYRKLTGRNFNAPVLSWPRAREMRFTSGDASGKGRRNARLVLVSYIRKTASMPADPAGIELLIVRRIPRDPRMAASTANPLSPQRNALRGSTAWATVS